MSILAVILPAGVPLSPFPGNALSSFGDFLPSQELTVMIPSSPFPRPILFYCSVLEHSNDPKYQPPLIFFSMNYSLVLVSDEIPRTAVLSLVVLCLRYLGIFPENPLPLQFSSNGLLYMQPKSSDKNSHMNRYYDIILTLNGTYWMKNF